MRWIRFELREPWHRIARSTVADLVDRDGIIQRRRVVTTLCELSRETATTPAALPGYGARVCDLCLAVLRNETPRSSYGAKEGVANG